MNNKQKWDSNKRIIEILRKEGFAVWRPLCSERNYYESDLDVCPKEKDPSSKFGTYDGEQDIWHIYYVNDFKGGIKLEDLPQIRDALRLKEILAEERANYLESPARSEVLNRLRETAIPEFEGLVGILYG